jgi:hypothetical protein
LVIRGWLFAETLRRGFVPLPYASRSLLPASWVVVAPEPTTKWQKGHEAETNIEKKKIRGSARSVVATTL